MGQRDREFEWGRQDREERRGRSQFGSERSERRGYENEGWGSERSRGRDRDLESYSGGFFEGYGRGMYGGAGMSGDYDDRSRRDFGRQGRGEYGGSRPDYERGQGDNPYYGGGGMFGGGMGGYTGGGYMGGGLQRSAMENEYGRSEYPRREQGSRGFGGYGSEGYGRSGASGYYGEERNFGRSDQDRWGRDDSRNYADRERRAGREGEGWWDRMTNEVASWFEGDDRDKRSSYRGRGPRNYTRSDDRIREDINDRLTDHYVLDASDIEVEVSNTEVTLSGNVRSRYEKRLAEDIAEAVSGVTHVENRIRVQRDAGQSFTGERSTSGGFSTGSTTGNTDLGTDVGTTGSAGDTGTTTSARSRGRSAGS